MNPVLIEDSISIAATSVVDNLLVSNPSLRRYLRCPFPARGKFLAVQSATGLRVQLDYGSMNVIGDSDPRIVAAGNDLTDTLDNINDDWYPDEGDQLVLRVTNTTAGALTLRYRITLHPLVEEIGQKVRLPPSSRVMQRGAVAIANNTVDQQLLSGLRYERAIKPSFMKILMTSSAAGMSRQLFVANENVAPPSAITPNNRVPQDPFDVTIRDVEVEPDKLIELSVTNTSGGALNVFWRQVLKELIR